MRVSIHVPPSRRRTALVLRALAASQRRRILYSLLDIDPDEALHVAKAIHFGQADLSRLDRKLRHQHLPMLEHAELIRPDGEPVGCFWGRRLRESEH